MSIEDDIRAAAAKAAESQTPPKEKPKAKKKAKPRKKKTPEQRQAIAVRTAEDEYYTDIVLPRLGQMVKEFARGYGPLTAAQLMECELSVLEGWVQNNTPGRGEFIIAWKRGLLARGAFLERQVVDGLWTYKDGPKFDYTVFRFLAHNIMGWSEPPKDGGKTAIGDADMPPEEMPAPTFDPNDMLKQIENAVESHIIEGEVVDE